MIVRQNNKIARIIGEQQKGLSKGEKRIVKGKKGLSDKNKDYQTIKLGMSGGTFIVRQKTRIVRQKEQEFSDKK